MRSALQVLVSAFMVMLLISCGGGGDISKDPTGGGTGTDELLTLTMTIAEKESGNESNELSSDTPLTVTVTVVDSANIPQSDKLINFSFSLDGLAFFDPESGSSVTNADGVATIDLLVGEVEGGGLVIAQLDTSESAEIGFNSAGDGAVVQPALILTPDIGILSASGELETNNNLTASTPLTVQVQVTDSGVALPNQLVTFTFSNPELNLAFFDPDSGTALTDSDGIASIGLLVGETEGSGLIIATMASGESASIGFNSSGGGSQAVEQPAFLDFFASIIQLGSSGSDEVELVALVKNENNVLMEGVDVSFSANSNASLQITQSVTTADGTARAILTTTNQPENRTITASVQVGSLSQTLDIAVVGTDVKINAPVSVILTANDFITIVVADSDGIGIANQEVILTSANGNQLSDTNPITDETGQVTVNYVALNSGVDTISATALNATGTATISVQQDQFSFTTVPTTDIPLATDATVVISWLRQSEAFVGGDVVFSTTRGTLSTTTGVTDAEGNISLSIQSSSAGAAVITAQGTDAEGNVVNARGEVEFIATTVDSIIVEASPNSIGPDGQKSTITAVLRDPSGNLVKGKTINFKADDVSGGGIDPAKAVTDSNGLASTVYTSNTVTSENAITITATESDSGQFATTELTVGDRALFITLGTGNRIQVPDDASYLKTFTLFVTDANSNPVNNVNLTVTGTPVKYTELLDPNASPGDSNFGVRRAAFSKGYWIPFPSAEAFEFWVPVTTISCANEDIDNDAVLDPGEDENGDTELSPGNVVAIDGNVTTDENGQALVNVRYSKQFAAWATIKITVSTPVAGSESKASQYYTLSAAGEDLIIQSTPPNSNPYGTGLNSVEDPANPGTFIDDGANLTCTNTL